MKTLRFIYGAIRANLANSAELRASFIINVLGMMLNNSAFIVLWVSFAHTMGPVGGWTSYDVVGMLGISTLSYGIVFSFAFGVERIPEYVHNGSFDQFLLSPKNILVRTATSTINPSAVGDILFGVACLTFYALHISASPLQLLLGFVLMIIATIQFFSSVLMITSLSFIFADGKAVTRGLFELFLSPTLFHGGAFQGVTRFIFTFIIPSLIISALPLEAMRDLSLSTTCIIGTISMLWCWGAITLFHKMIRRYESGNLMTFGS